jgi:hypothetical protein
MEEPTASIQVPHDQPYMFDNADRRTIHGVTSFELL